MEIIRSSSRQPGGWGDGRGRAWGWGLVPTGWNGAPFSSILSWTRGCTFLPLWGCELEKEGKGPAGKFAHFAVAGGVRARGTELYVPKPKPAPVWSPSRLTRWCLGSSASLCADFGLTFAPPEAVGSRGQIKAQKKPKKTKTRKPRSKTVRRFGSEIRAIRQTGW